MPSRTTPFELQNIPGYPEMLQIYRIQASSSWQVRMFVDRKYVRKSTGTDDKKIAVEFAKKLYDTIRINQRLDVSVHTDTFQACAEHLLRREESLVAMGQRDSRIVTEDRKKLTRDILPFFGRTGVASVTTSTIDDYLASLGRQLSPSTLAKHLVVIRKVLGEARRRGFINAQPPFPPIRRRDNPRPYFTIPEARTLRTTARKLVEAKNISVRGVPLTDDIFGFIVFAMNVFVRPSDLKLLRHRDVQVITEKSGTAEVSYLSIIPPNSKTVVRESLSMPMAVVVYKGLKAFQARQGRAGPDDFVFFPQYPNREYALATIRRQFEFVLEKAELRKDRLGRNRTIYSLRHTALMHRLLKGDNVDIFILARNALTSVNQLERFYLSHAVSRDKIENLQSIRPRS